MLLDTFLAGYREIKRIKGLKFGKRGTLDRNEEKTKYEETCHALKMINVTY